MPISGKMTYGSIVAEVLRSYKKTGRIGNTKPRNMKHALRIAQAIAAAKKGISR